MTKIYETKKKKIEAIGAPPSNQPWFEHFDNIFSNIAKISDIPNVINLGVHVMNSNIETVNVSDEEDVQTPQMPSSPQTQTLVFREDNVHVETTPFC